jgi:hypothetical protein
MAASTNSSEPSIMLNLVNPAAGAANATVAAGATMGAGAAVGAGATVGAGDRTTALAVATTIGSALSSGRLGRVAATVFAGAPALRAGAAIAAGGAASGRPSALAGGSADTMSCTTRGVDTMAGTRRSDPANISESSAI